MKSIRRSLILKVLALLVVTLAAVFGLSYRIVEWALEEKKRAAVEILDRQYREKIDDALRERAETLGRNVALQTSQRRPVELDYAPLGLLAAMPTPYAHVQFPFWYLQGGRLDRGGLAWESRWLAAMVGTKIEPREELLSADPRAVGHEHMQVNGQWGKPWHYPKSDPLRLPFDIHELTSPTTPLERFPEEPIAGTKQRLRRIVIKVAIERFLQLYLDRPLPHAGAMLGGTLIYREISQPGPSFRGPRSGPPPGPVVLGSRTVDGSGAEGIEREALVPKVIVQVAWNLDSGHPKILEFQQKRREEEEKLDHEIQTTLARLRSNFLVIGGVALSLLFVGGWLLVGIALNPLKRLSTAVSQISPKDFRLPIDVTTLPKEVNPVASRLRASLAELQKAFEREKRAAADISHELRTPLAALTTTIEVTLRKNRSEEHYRETLQDCQEIARQMSHLVERLLTLAWIDAGADRMSLQDVEVGPLISECSTIGRPLAEAQGLHFRVRMPEPMTVHTDRDKLREVLMNLVHNAIEYNRPGGEIEVTASSNGNGGVVFEVRDTGIGIARDMQDKIFERFYRGDPSRNAAGVHAGLGLAIVKEYIDRLGGKLVLDSALGQGSRFRVELPKVSGVA